MKTFKWIPAFATGLLLGLCLVANSLGQQRPPDFGPIPEAPVTLKSAQIPATRGPAITLQPRGGGSFGGGGRSFGGGGRSFGGGGGFGGGGRSFGGSSSSSGSFGGSGRSFGGSSSSPRSSSSPGGGSFGNHGSMQSRGPTTSTTARSGYGSTYYGGRTVYYAPGGYWGGYSYGWFHPAWYYYTPFYPSFYFSPPYVDQYGYYQPGGFSFFKLLEGLVCCFCGFLVPVWLLLNVIRGGGKGVKYTTYQ